MSQIRSVKTIQHEIDLLNVSQEKMIEAAKKLTTFFYKPEGFAPDEDLKQKSKEKITIFDLYDVYHTLLSDWSYSLITITPYLPNNIIPTVEPKKPEELPEGESSLVEKMKNSETGLVKGVVIGLTNIPLYFLAMQRLVSWTVPVIFSGCCVAVLFAPQLAELYTALKGNKEADEEDDLQTNPTDWIAREIQVMSDKYDGIRLLIYKQDVKTERVASIYSQKNAALYQRKQQEIELFPTECLNVIRKIMVFCNNAFQERKAFLISCLKAPTYQVQPQPLGVPSQ